MALKNPPLALVFEPMQSRDLQQVLAIENECFEHPWSEASFALSLKCPRAYEHFYVAKIGRASARESRAEGNGFVVIHNETLARSMRRKDTVVGYIVFSVFCEEAHILNIAVQPRYRRQGIGKYLLASALERIRARDGREIFLEVAVSNLPAQYLYRQFGFRICGIRKHYYGRYKDAYVFRKGAKTDAI